MYVEVKNTNIKFYVSLFRLRVRIKALQQTIDTQSVRITDLISSQVLASMNGMDNYTFLLFSNEWELQNLCHIAMWSGFIIYFSQDHCSGKLLAVFSLQLLLICNFLDFVLKVMWMGE